VVSGTLFGSRPQQGPESPRILANRSNGIAGDFGYGLVGNVIVVSTGLWRAWHFPNRDEGEPPLAGQEKPRGVARVFGGDDRVDPSQLDVVRRKVKGSPAL